MRQANRRKFHYIYKTTCKITSKYYIGMHSTDNLDDGYIGSGKRLWYSINKHGKENHVCEILEFLPDRKALKAREAELVCEDKLTDPLCMNLKVGGEGGWDHVNETRDPEAWRAIQALGGAAANKIRTKRLQELIASDADYRSERRKNISAGVKAWFDAGNINAFKGQKHSQESKDAISAKNSVNQAGMKNSQYGTCWVSKDGFAKKIAKALLSEYLDAGWFSGRKH